MLLAEAQRLVMGALLAWTPRVAPGGVGRFFCEPIGERWADDVRAGLAAWGEVRIGIGAWATVAHAGALRDAGWVAPSILDRAPLAVLELDARAIEDLAALGIRSVAALRALDPVDLGVRFGAAVASAWRRAHGQDPRGPTTPPPDHPAEVEVTLDGVEICQIEPLLFVLRPALERLLRAPVGRGQGVTTLQLALDTATPTELLITIRCAHPIGDPRTLLELLRARLERTTLRSAIGGFRLSATSLAPLTDRNTDLFHVRRRDAAARDVALARLASRFGSDAVRRASRVELAAPLARARWTREAPSPGASAPWRQQDPPAPLIGEHIDVAGKRRRLVKLGRIERVLAPWWDDGALRVDRLAWAEVDGPLLVMLRARRSAWEVIAWVD